MNDEADAAPSYHRGLSERRHRNLAFSDVEGTMIADAARRLDEARAEAKRIARSRITVDREWFLQQCRELIFSMEVRWKLADRRGDYNRRAEIEGKLARFRQDADETLREEPK